MSNNFSTLLILGAFGPEIEALRSKSSEGRDISLSVAETGIGLVQASIRTTKLILELRAGGKEPHILFVGSVGTNDTSIPLGAFANISSVTLADVALARGEGFLPAPVVQEFSSDEVMGECIVSALVGAPHASGRAYTSLSITAHDVLAQLLAQHTRAKFENLELFGVAQACSELGVPWNALCPVTNFIGANGHEEWKARHTAASETLAVFLRDRLLPKLERLVGDLSTKEKAPGL